jgi:anti-sigma B factor antagonist
MACGGRSTSKVPAGKDWFSLVSKNLDSTGKPRINIIATEDETLACLSGRIDIDSSPAVRDQLLSLLQPPYPRMISVDMSGVTHIDSAGIATLVEALKIAREKKIEMRLQGLHGSLLRLFESTCILPLFDGNLRMTNPCECEAP